MRTWLATLTLALQAACGGRVEELDGGSRSQTMPTTRMDGVGRDAAGDEGASAEGSVGAGDFPVCPPDPPAVGSPCMMPPSQGCSYVARQTTWTCKAFVCDTAGHWRAASDGCGGQKRSSP